MERIQKQRSFESAPPPVDVRHLSHARDPAILSGGIARDYLCGSEPDYDNNFHTICDNPGAAHAFSTDWEGRYRKLNTRKGPAYHTSAEPPPYIF